jgi:hypothetical protein
MKADRELIAMARTMDLDAIAKQTGRSRGRLIKTAKRLGISIKGSAKIGR